MNAGTLLPVRVPIALLLHETSDGGSHFDVLIATTDAPIADDDRTVRAFRVGERPDRLAAGTSIALEELPAHRGLYLRLERAVDLSDGRGRVTPLRRGTGDFRCDGAALVISACWAGDASTTWTIRPAEGTRWQLEVA